MNPPRNTSCPCNSGYQYLDCCGKQFHSTLPPEATEIQKRLAAKIHECGETSLEEANIIAQEITLAKNNQPIDALLGLSPLQLCFMLEAPFDATSIVAFNLEHYPKAAPALSLFEGIAAAINNNGLKATAQGNLPIKLCRELLDCYPQPSVGSKPSSIRSETEFDTLHCLRITAELAGLITLHNSRFYLTDKGQQLTASDQRGALYQCLLKTYCTQFNWSYRDGYDDASLIQYSFLFSLYCLSLFGNQWRDVSFYENLFIKAFSSVIGGMPKDNYLTQEQQLRLCYRSRMMENLAGFWGLADLRLKDKQHYLENYQIHATGVLSFIQFNC